MFIRQKEYERLVNSDKIRQKLEQEVKRLAEQISAEVKDCKVGPWCKDCQHIGNDSADLTIYSMWDDCEHVVERAGRVTYCKKHLHEICPEFEQGGV